MIQRKRRTFTKELKIVGLYATRKSRTKIIKEYNLTLSALDKWVRQHKETSSFAGKDSRIPEQEEANEALQGKSTISY